MNRFAHWSWLVAISGLLAIVGYYIEGGQWLHWISKPLTTLLIFGMALRFGVAGRYRNGILVGLLFSTAGDVFLMLPGDRFVQGLLSFLLAHLAYLWAFRARAAWLARSAPFLLYGAVSAAIVVLLWPGMPGSLRLPVTIYVLALAAMASQAAVGWQLRRDRPSLYAALGGAFFVFSDSIIAVNRFVLPFEASKGVILVSYWLAQWLIARSIGTAAEPKAVST